jgi:hypothetical protein
MATRSQASRQALQWEQRWLSHIGKYPTKCLEKLRLEKYHPSRFRDKYLDLSMGKCLCQL